MNKEFTVETLNRMIDKVVIWNELGGNLVTNTDLKDIYLQLAREEMFGQNEFLQGWFSKDKVMQADGIADLVFTVGFLSRLVNNTQTLFTPQEISQMEESQCVDYLSSDLVHYTSRVYDSLHILCAKMSEHFDVEEVFNLVYESNMSKYNLVSEIDNLGEELEVILNKGRYGDLSVKTVPSPEGDRYVFLAGKDLQSGVEFAKPKIIKSSKFFEPEGIEKFIY